MSLQDYAPEAMSNAAPPCLALACTLAKHLVKDRVPGVAEGNNIPDLEQQNVNGHDVAHVPQNDARPVFLTRLCAWLPHSWTSSRNPVVNSNLAELSELSPDNSSSAPSTDNIQPHPYVQLPPSTLPPPDQFTLGDSETEEDVSRTHSGATQTAP
jgi:hypothetical protein